MIPEGLYFFLITEYGFELHSGYQHNILVPAIAFCHYNRKTFLLKFSGSAFRVQGSEVRNKTHLIG